MGVRFPTPVSESSGMPDRRKMRRGPVSLVRPLKANPDSRRSRFCCGKALGRIFKHLNLAVAGRPGRGVRLLQFLLVE